MHDSPINGPSYQDAQSNSRDLDFSAFRIPRVSFVIGAALFSVYRESVSFLLLLGPSHLILYLLLYMLWALIGLSLG
jgi:hypothetical protein